MVTVPGWLRPTSAEPAPGACEALGVVAGYQGEFINFFQQTAITREDAPAVALAHAQSTVDVDGEIAVTPHAALVRATFPQAGERLAWLVLATLPRDGARFERVASVFIDADTGDLLALSLANTVADSAAGCGSMPLTRRELVRQYLPVLIAVAYSGFIVLGITLARWWKRIRAR